MSPRQEAERIVRDWLCQYRLGPAIPAWAVDALERAVREGLEGAIAHVAARDALEPQP